jgi:hypothetical protein
MRQAQLDSNSDSTAGRKNRRPAFTFAAGLVALAVGAAIVIDQPGGGTSAQGDPATSNVVSGAAASAENGTASANTTSAVEAAKPRFERSDEPAVEDSVNSHGG